MPYTPIYLLEVVPLDSTGEQVATSLAGRIAATQTAVGGLGVSENQRLFAGTIRYVSSTGDDSDDGLSPTSPMLTIGAAIAASSLGDAITVKAGTYTETGLDLDVTGLELWPEIGTVIDPASGTALTVSGNYCRIVGDFDIDVPAGQIGLLVSGNYCNISDGTILYGATGLHITGAGCTFTDMAIGFQTVVSYDVDGSQTRLVGCHTVGDAATIGFNIGNSADTGVFEHCTSSGHQTAGFYIETGCQDWTLLHCSSGAGDGKWTDVDSANVWSEFTFSDEVYHVMTFAGGGGSSENLFQVTGGVEILSIYGHVETVLSADVDDIYLDLWDGTVSVEITDNGGTDTNSADVGSVFVKTERANTAITLMQSNQGRVEENTNANRPRLPFFLNQKKDTNTYIRLVYSGVATSGMIHWHCRWTPLTSAGFVAAV